MKIYIASRYGRRKEMAGYAEKMQALGHEITSRWIFGEHELQDDKFNSVDDADRTDVGRQFAQEDLEDLKDSEMVICFTETPGASPGRNRGGRHFEAGVAHALGKRIVVVGPRENVFYCLPEILHYENPLSFVTELQRAHASKVEHANV